MAQVQTVGIAIGIVLFFFLLFLGCTIARRKKMYIQFIPGMAEPRDRLAARYDPRKGRGKKSTNVPTVLKPYDWKTGREYADGSGSGNVMETSGVVERPAQDEAQAVPVLPAEPAPVAAPAAAR